MCRIVTGVDVGQRYTIRTTAIMVVSSHRTPCGDNVINTRAAVARREHWRACRFTPAMHVSSTLRRGRRPRASGSFDVNAAPLEVTSSPPKETCHNLLLCVCCTLAGVTRENVSTVRRLFYFFSYFFFFFFTTFSYSHDAIVRPDRILYEPLEFIEHHDSKSRKTKKKYPKYHNLLSLNKHDSNRSVTEFANILFTS